MRKTTFSVVCVLLTVFTFGQTEGQDLNYLSTGGLKLTPYGYGAFNTAPHVNTDANFTDFVNFQFHGALWVGAVTSAGDTVITCGDGNESTFESEWHAWLEPIALDVKANDQIEERIRYHDQHEVAAHQSLDLAISQTVFAHNRGEYFILRFAVHQLPSTLKYSEIAVGFFADVDVPEDNGKRSPDNDSFGISKDGSAGYIYNGDDLDAQVPFLGAATLNVTSPVVSSWILGEKVPDDRQRFRYLTGLDKTAGNEVGDCRLTVGGGPFFFSSSDTLYFDVALVQGQGLSNFEENLAFAQQFYKENIGPRSTLEKAARPEAGAPAPTSPRRFHLAQNYPNPLSPKSNSALISTTAIDFELAEASKVTLSVYNVLGQEVRRLLLESKEAGFHTISWNGNSDSGKNLAPGVYIYLLRAETEAGFVFVQQRKMIITR